MIHNERSGIEQSISTQIQKEKQNFEQRFDEWLSNNKEEARKLEIPDEFLGVLVPEKVYEIAKNKKNVEAMCLESKERLSFIVVEHDYPQNLTSKEA